MNEKVTNKIADIDQQIKYLEQRKQNLTTAAKALEDCPFTWDFCGDSIDFDNLSHDDVIQVIKYFGGKWRKELASHDETKINYIKEESIANFQIRCWNGAPPDTCEIVEEEVEVPEEVVPAHTKTVRKLKCVPDLTIA